MLVYGGLVIHIWFRGKGIRGTADPCNVYSNVKTSSSLHLSSSNDKIQLIPAISLGIGG